MTSPPLLALPAELLEQVMYQLDFSFKIPVPADVQQDRLDSLLAVSSSCKELHAAVEPFLYRVFTSARATSVGHFLRVLCRRPQIAEYIQILGLNTSATTRVPPHRNEHYSIRKAMAPFERWKLYNDLLWNLFMGCQAANVLLILSLTTKIQYLYLDPTGGAPSCCPPLATLVRSFLIWAGTTSGTLYGRLKDLVVDNCNSKDVINDNIPSELVYQFMQLPALRAVVVKGPMPLPRSQSTRASSSNVSDLKISGYHGSKIEASCALIDACRALKRLDIVCYNDSPPANGALQRHKSTLESMIILETFDITSGLCDLHGFERLQYLELSHGLFSGNGRHFPVLPASLKHMTIDTPLGLDGLFKYASTASPHLNPQLESFAISGYPGERDAKYVDLIQGVYMRVFMRASRRFVIGQNSRMKEGTDWIVLLGAPVESIGLVCRRGKQSISETIAGVVNDIAIFGLTRVLEDYNANWSPRNSVEEEAELKMIKRRFH